MDYLYAPWRDHYIQGQENRGCVFCYAWDHPLDDATLGVLWSDKACMVIMNKYPYTPGHFMVIPACHTDNIETLETSVWLEMMVRVQQGVKMIKEVLGSHGVNIGMNLGKAGGAGIAEHVHVHLVPRWERDTNFITTIAEARVYSTSFETIYQKLLTASPMYFGYQESQEQ